MSVDLSNYKIQTFSGINATPVAPIATKAGNGSHFISLYNNLIDKLQLILNSLPSSSGSSLTCTVTTPSSLDNEKLEVYYRNVSEYELYTETPTNFQGIDLIHTYELTTDFTPGGVIDISPLIQNQGIGYYFFLFMKADGTYKSDSSITFVSLEPLGTVKRINKDINVSIYDAQYNLKSASRIRPLAITQLNGSVAITIADEEFVIG